MAISFTAFDTAVSKFRVGSPNIAAAFDEVKRLLQQLDAQPAGFTLAEWTPSRVINGRTATQQQLTNVVATLINDLRK